MVEIEPFDAARYLTSPESQAELLKDALASSNARYLAQALGVIVRALTNQHSVTSTSVEPPSAEV
jgi:DNA-binding phage protein